MNEIAGWIAPAATMIAAMMTAANLGARVTGWGFVVFTIGSIGWVIVGSHANQPGLLATNVFLTLVNIAGIWRWLGRQARYEAVGSAAEDVGQAPAVASVTPASAIIGRKIVDPAGADAGEAVDVIIDSASGAVAYLVVRIGGVAGIGERVVALPRAAVQFAPDAIRAREPAAAVAARADLDSAEWRRLLG